jgi:alpha-L-fucosidase
MALLKKGLPRADFWDGFAREVPSWYTDVKLGIFVSWGPFSVPAYGEPVGELGTVDETVWFKTNPYAEWYFNTMRIEGSGAQLHHREHYGDAPYDEFLDNWQIPDFDPDAWCKLFYRAGARYIVPLSKHHDGVTLWDAPGTGTRNTVHRGPKLDIMQAIADAARKNGIRFAVYYSGGLDWGLNILPPIQTFADVTDLRPNDAAYSMYAYDHVEDLINRYQPDILWNDIEWPDFSKLNDASVDYTLAKLFKHYYEKVPHGLVNDRWGDTHYDFKTSEYQALQESEDAAVWENCRGIGMSFGYNQYETEEHSLSVEGALAHFIDIVSRGGNLLLNVGPTASGAIPDIQKRVLEGMGDWMALNSAAIYETHKITDLKASNPEGGSAWVRFTAKPDRIYAHIAASGEVSIELPAKLVRDDSAKLLASGDALAVQRSGDTVRVKLPAGTVAGPQVIEFRRA